MLHPQLSPYKDVVSQTKHFALKVSIALRLPGRGIFHQQPKTGAGTAAALGFLSLHPWVSDRRLGSECLGNSEM